VISGGGVKREEEGKEARSLSRRENPQQNEEREKRDKENSD